MNLNFFRNIVFFIILVVVQTLVLNHIRLFGCATPLLYVYFVLPTRRDTPRWQTLLWSFAIGLAVDVFSNTPGVGAASMTLLGLLQPYLLTLFVPRDSADDLRPSFATLGTSKYVSYTIFMVLVYCLTFFTLEAFNMYNILQWAVTVAACTALTTVLILVIEKLRRR
jgi:rod shape-determining protein MreD